MVLYLKSKSTKSSPIYLKLVSMGGVLELKIIEKRTSTKYKIIQIISLIYFPLYEPGAVWSLSILYINTDLAPDRLFSSVSQESMFRRSTELVS